MAVINPEDIIQEYEYITQKLSVIIPDSDPLELEPNQLSQLDIEENFEEYYFPFIKVTLIISSNDYYKIMKHKNKCKLNIRIDKRYNSTKKNDKSLRKVFINKTFNIIMDENTEDMKNSLKEDASKTDYTQRISKGVEDNDNKIEFYLFTDIIEGTKKNINKVIRNGTVTNAIAHIATVGGINNIIMPPAHNTTVYPEMLLPELSVLKSLAYIDTYYGIFKTGTIIFFDIDYTYIIPYSGNCDAYLSKEITTTNIIVPKSVNTNHENTLGSLKKPNDKNNNYVIGDYSTLDISNKSISNNYINANSTTVYDSYNESKSTSTSKAKAKNKNFTKFLENKTENPFIATMYSAQSNAKSDVISIRLYDFDISVITPNKKFNMIFEDSKYRKKYNGSYILVGTAHTFVSKGSTLGLSSVVMLRKA